MAEAHSHLSASHLCVDLLDAQINGIIAERAEERLRKAPATEPTSETQALEPREPGVYFGLPSAEYHADPSLGSTDIKLLLRSPTDYWWLSAMNPNRPPSPDTEDRKIGRALHKLILEGPEAFERAFVEEPVPEGYPGCLVTLDDLRSYAREKGIKAERGEAPTTKAGFAKLIRKHDPDVMIFEEIQSLFQAMVVRDGLETLKPTAMAEVRQAAAGITTNPHLAAAFQGGVPEVSCFWVDRDGIPCKCRLDWLKPRTLVELKKCTNTRERPFDVAVRLAIAEYRYDVQAAYYLQGFEALYSLAAQGKVFGDCPLREGWHTRVLPPGEMRWTWIFRQIKGAPIAKGFEVLPTSPALNRATREIALAKATFLRCRSALGTSMWLADEPVEPIELSDLPVWMREEAEVL